MTKSFVRRVNVLEDFKTRPAVFDFALALREARMRAAAGDPILQTPITAEMIADPVHGEFWRKMSKARERVRLLRHAVPAPDPGVSGISQAEES